jgi:hypothetical protein
VADHIQKTRHPTLSASVAKAIEQRLLKRATELRQSRARSWALPFSLRPLGTVAATLIVVMALVLAGGGGIVYASTDSLPGSPLYGVKRATEQVQLFLAPAGTKQAELHIRLAQKRMEEVQALAEIKGQVAEEALAAMSEETELALEEAEKAPAQDKLALLDKLVNLTQRQQAVLGRVQTKAPEAAQKGLSRALEASQQGYEKVREALEKEKPGRDVKPSKLPCRPRRRSRPTRSSRPRRRNQPMHLACMTRVRGKARRTKARMKRVVGRLLSRLARRKTKVVKVADRLPSLQVGQVKSMGRLMRRLASRERITVAAGNMAAHRVKARAKASS